MFSTKKTPTWIEQSKRSLFGKGNSGDATGLHEDDEELPRGFADGLLAVAEALDGGGHERSPGTVSSGAWKQGKAKMRSGGWIRKGFFFTRGSEKFREWKGIVQPHNADSSGRPDRYCLSDSGLGHQAPPVHHHYQRR